MTLRLPTLLLTAALVAAPALAAMQEPAQPGPAAPETVPAEATPDPTGSQREPAADEPESVRAFRALDLRRLESDRAYAESMIRHFDALPPVAADDEHGRLRIEGLRIYAMVTAGRTREAGALIDDVLARRPGVAAAYALPWFGALRLNDADRAIAVVEQATRSVRSSEWPSLRALLEKDHVWMVMRRHPGEAGLPRRARLAEALFRIGWPGHDDPAARDSLRMIMLNAQLARSDLRDAADLAAGITTSGNMVSLITLKRYDAVIGSQDRLALLGRAIAAEDQATAAAVAAAPEDLSKLLGRALFLREQGRDADAFALLEPFTRDVAATVARDDDGMWVINEAAYALLALGRDDEAVALTAAVAALPIAGRPELISISINHSAVLLRAGRNEEALAHATRLDRDFSQHASEYGRMWMLASAACALERLGRREAVAPLLRRLRSGRAANPAALTRTYLCLNDLGAAEALVIQRLRGDEAELLVRSFQDFRIAGAVAEDPVLLRFESLRQRPAVRAAIERVGRILPLPMARTYWGAT